MPMLAPSTDSFQLLEGILPVSLADRQVSLLLYLLDVLLIGHYPHRLSLSDDVFGWNVRSEYEFGLNNSTSKEEIEITLLRNYSDVRDLPLSNRGPPPPLGGLICL